MKKYDAIVVGSGFGGSVAALRLAEKGYSVCVLEEGRRFEDAEFAKTSWRLRDFLFAPQLGCYGIQRIHLLSNVAILAGAGVGGGSLVYANTMYVPPAEFFANGPWAKITDWQAELAPFYDLAQRMLGVEENPTDTPADLVCQRVAERMGVRDTYQRTPVAVHFGKGPGVVSPDPYFGGVGPARAGCTQCGECMTGCRHNAKNTLVKNYLALAEKLGVEIRPLSKVTGLDRTANNEWRVTVKTLRGNRHSYLLAAQHVVVAAGAFGSQKLLHKMKDAGRLPGLSAQLGHLSRSNSESLIGAVAHRVPNPDFTTGVAITSSFHPTPDTHIEPVRYGRGSNAMGLLQTLLTDAVDNEQRWRTWFSAVRSDPRYLLRTLNLRKWSERGVIALVMQSLDNSVTVFGDTDRFGRWRLRSKQGIGEPNPRSIPIANEAARLLAEEIDGFPVGNLGEVIDAPFTAHFVGGCVIGDSLETGVVDAYLRAYGEPGLHIVDGSTVSANLGVNPSLTITAQAERAFALWPNKGDADPRPNLGAPYARLDPIRPKHPAVPAGAPAALTY